MKSYQGYLHLASTSVLCASIVALGYLLHSSNDKVKNTSSIEDKLVSNDSYPEAIQDELLSRVKTFFGDAEFNKLNNSFVIVVGLGGVGSHAANMLVRSGVKNIRLIDFDQVTLSSLNRHAVATMEDVGISKAEAMKKRLLKVVPWCNITAITEMFRAVDADRLLEGNPDYVLDCIDDVNTKAELIAYCVNKNIKVFTSMGAGAKADPTKLRIATLVNCIHDPLASKIKWKLKKHSISPDDVMCIFSIENPKANLLPLDDEQKQNPQDYGVVDYLRLRVIPVLGTSPSIFGQAMTSYVLCQLAGKPYEPDSGERMSKSLRHKLRQILNNNEQRRFQSRAELDIDDDDMYGLIELHFLRYLCTHFLHY
jgi:tRNA A37 threonylcarbamoyladenosine dehydratase